jgi:hypothetical protein
VERWLVRLPTCRVDEKLHPTDWLESLPQSTLVDLMQRRCRYIAAAAVQSLGMKSCRKIHGLKALTTWEITRLESHIFT